MHFKAICIDHHLESCSARVIFNVPCIVYFMNLRGVSVFWTMPCTVDLMEFCRASDVFKASRKRFFDVVLHRFSDSQWAPKLLFDYALPDFNAFQGTTELL